MAVCLPATFIFVATFPRDAFFVLPYAQDAGVRERLGALDRLTNLMIDLFPMTAIEIGQLALLDRAYCSPSSLPLLGC